MVRVPLGIFHENFRTQIWHLRRRFDFLHLYICAEPTLNNETQNFEFRVYGYVPDVHACHARQATSSVLQVVCKVATTPRLLTRCTSF